MKKITYSSVGDNYDTKDPIKKLAQESALKTSINLSKHGFSEVSDTRGESAYVWRQGNVLMASVIEGLGTKNLVADEMSKITGKSHYDIVGHETIATIINDLVTVGAKPLVVHAYWAIENNDWFNDRQRIVDLIHGWKHACNLSGASWGGGETPTLKGIINKNSIDLGGSAVGIIKKKKHLLLDSRIRKADRVILLKSTGINTNGLSLVRAIAKKLSKGYATKLPSGIFFGEAVLNKSNIYANLISELLEADLDIHYTVNITGHGLRKIMRAKQDFSYILENLFEAPEVFPFIQEHAGLSDTDMYGTFNMGNDYVLFLPQEDVEKALTIIRKNKFQGLDAGYIEKGERQVIIKSKNINFKGNTLNLR